MIYLPVVLFDAGMVLTAVGAALLAVYLSHRPHGPRRKG